MAQFSAANANFTPVANATQLNNWVLTQLTAGNIASVKMINWGGSGTSLVGYVTRWVRVSNTPATPSALTIQSSSPGITPNSSVNTYTTQATGAAQPAGLFQQNWNVQGGGGVVVLPIGGEWRITGGALGTAYNQIGCGNISGADANLSNYGIQFEE
jgi:hypothetical protein